MEKLSAPDFVVEQYRSGSERTVWFLRDLVHDLARSHQVATASSSRWAASLRRPTLSVASSCA